LPEFFKAVGAARFGVMAGVAAVLTAFFLYIAGAIGEPPESILYAGLEPRDAAAVTAKLDAMNVKYDAKDGGGTIMVPADQVTKLRMALAQDNLPAAGVGYEIFDKTSSFGTTTFVQNINKLRAMEGELSRSIRTIDGIEGARVHLVIPQHEIFSHDTQTPSASVVLKTRAVLQRGTVQAIQHLVAAAVAGMTPDRVAILDDRGNLLAGGEGKTGPGAIADNEEQATTDYEERLRKRVESIVASVVGPGHVRVQVNADMQYNHTSTTSENFNPDGKVVRSTQTVDRNSSDGTPSGGGAVSVSSALPGAASNTTSGTDKSTTSSNEETTNYEISKTVQTSTDDGGDLKKLSVAVVVDGTTGAKDTDYKPRSPAEMAQITKLVKSTIGFDAARGDQLQVVNMKFARLDVGDVTAAPAPLLGLDGADWFRIIKAGILSLTALLIGLFVARPLIARMFAPNAPASPALLTAASAPAPGQLPAPDGAQAGAAPALAPPSESSIDISRIEGQVRDSAAKKVGEVVSAHPEEALAIIRTWLHQPV
jgi:flagellar M-ring protein FliF